MSIPGFGVWMDTVMAFCFPSLFCFLLSHGQICQLTASEDVSPHEKIVLGKMAAAQPGIPQSHPSIQAAPREGPLPALGFALLCSLPEPLFSETP